MEVILKSFKDILPVRGETLLSCIKSNEYRRFHVHDKRVEEGVLEGAHSSGGEMSRTTGIVGIICKYWNREDIHSILSDET